MGGPQGGQGFPWANTNRGHVGPDLPGVVADFAYLGQGFRPMGPKRGHFGQKKAWRVPHMASGGHFLR